jgi:hypothetical protein
MSYEKMSWQFSKCETDVMTKEHTLGASRPLIKIDSSTPSKPTRVPFDDSIEPCLQ